MYRNIRSKRLKKLVVIGIGVVFKVMRLAEINMAPWLKMKSPKTKLWDMPMLTGQKKKNEKELRISNQYVRKKANLMQCPRSNILKGNSEERDQLYQMLPIGSIFSIKMAR